MGLALHNSSDALDLTQRYLSPGPSQVSRPHQRAHYNGAYYHADGSIVLNRELAEHKLPLLDLVLLTNHQKGAQRHRQARRRQIGRSTRQWCIGDVAEGRTIALSGQQLPGEQRRRTPSLERQDAFRDARTTKFLTSPQDARDISELYRVGLLYDDEHLRGPGFGFDAIDRTEPEYTIRQAKQTRKTKPSGVPYDDDLQLALDLSLAELGHDEPFAQFLCSPGLEEPSSDDESTNSTNSTYSARLAPLHFVSELVHSPEYFSDNTLTMMTDSESESESISFPKDNACKIRRKGNRELHAANHDGANAWMMLGDGS
ncbi:uncharacterized protein ColSpa_07936 [Colletotrichum spaethianum]|uniref:Uncharacterized protein n=1 Tax=Colletotrichum spaethianum TaxID=700344 RepID=A0AA37P8T4_9PEZI|nr:uncharacterized protein ColSpa_07936 [Colletotrichum spaethianum]GKT47755.1 hypothetical protein ColSpa_07936 [Colletotrichum spaethianum]